MHKSSPQKQKELDFDRGRQLKLLAASSSVLSRCAASVLRAIDEVTWHDSSRQATIKQLAVHAGYSPRHVSRGIAQLEKLYVIKPTLPCGREGLDGRYYLISWENLAEMIEEQPRHEVISPHDKMSPPPRQNVMTPMTQCHDPHDTMSCALYTADSANPPPPLDGWNEVEEELENFGLDDAISAVARARKNGCSPAHILPVIEYARSQGDRYGAGAVYFRVVRLRPGQKPNEHWPPDSKEFLAKKRREQDASRSRQAAQEKAIEESRRQEVAAQKKAQESEFEPILAELSEEEILQMLHTRPGGSFVINHYKRFGLKSRSVKQFLIAQCGPSELQ